MLGRIALFELRYQLRGPLVYLSLVLFGLLGFGYVGILGATTSSPIQLNSPASIGMVVGILSLFALFVPLSIFASVALRNLTSGMDDLIRSYPVPAWRYVLARFAGAFLVASAILIAVMIGVIVGSHMWWIPADRIGPFRPASYAAILAMIGIPNLLIASTLFFAVATLARSMMAAYVSVAVFLFAYFATQMLNVEPAYRSLAAILDPFGIAAMARVTLYWTVSERNARLVPLEGLLLWNRVLWVVVSLALLAISVALSQRRDRATPAVPIEATPAAAPVSGTRAVMTWGGAGVWAQLAARTRLETRAILRSWIFVVLLALGAAGSVVALIFRGDFYGTPTLPVTTTIIESLQAPWVFVELIIVVAFAADLVWRERQTRIAEIIDVTPTPSWVFVLAKLAAVATVLLAITALAMVVGVAFQLINGVTRVDPGIYLTMLLVIGVLPMLMWGVLSVFVQTLVNRKFVGLLIMLLIVAAIVTAELLGKNDYLLMFASSPNVSLSDMNRYGHFLQPTLWFIAYWGCVTALLGLATHLLWVRGAAGGFASRLRRAHALVTPAVAGVAALAFAATGATGGYIYWNTHILNTYFSKSDAERRSADYEKTYRAFETLPQPRVTEVEMAVDLYPEAQAFSSRGRYTLVNRTKEPIETVRVQFDFDAKVEKVELTDAALIEQQPRFNHFVFRTRAPLAPGARQTLTFELSFRPPGFKNSPEVTPVVHNGSFAHDSDLAPAVGIPRSFYLKDAKKRRDHGLEPMQTTPAIDDKTQRRVNYIRPDSDFVRFALTVSTSADQVAIGPGYLQREWTVGDRRFFRYEMDKRIVNFWSVLSARYAVARDRWNDVELAVYHHPHHGTNVARMLDAVKQSLAYYSENFSTYQYRQLRILEFPRYATFAQSFPNTIPYSEGLGFIADNRDPKRLDYLWFVTAHEVAHQWWAHQVIGANVQGATLLSETLAEYSALMVMERRYGSEQMRQLLKYELDKYLAGRGQAGSPEQPLKRVGIDQMHIHYHKGALAMYALKDAIGEATVNRALARFLKKYAYRSSPYPTSVSLIKVLREEAGDAHQQLITDLFERITLWDLGVTGVEAKEIDGGQWRVRIDVRAKKLHADGRGKETEAPLDQAIDIGLFAADPAKPGLAAKDVIALEKRKIIGGTQSVEFLVDRKPAFVGIDPYIKLISRDTSSNVIAVR